MSWDEGNERSLLAGTQQASHEYQQLRGELPEATSYKPSSYYRQDTHVFLRPDHGRPFHLCF